MRNTEALRRTQIRNRQGRRIADKDLSARSGRYSRWQFHIVGIGRGGAGECKVRGQGLCGVVGIDWRRTN